MAKKTIFGKGGCPYKISANLDYILPRPDFDILLDHSF